MNTNKKLKHKRISNRLLNKRVLKVLRFERKSVML